MDELPVCTKPLQAFSLSGIDAWIFYCIQRVVLDGKTSSTSDVIFGVPESLDVTIQGKIYLQQTHPNISTCHNVPQQLILKTVTLFHNTRRPEQSQCSTTITDGQNSHTSQTVAQQYFMSRKVTMFHNNSWCSEQSHSSTMTPYVQNSKMVPQKTAGVQNSHTSTMPPYVQNGQSKATLFHNNSYCSTHYYCLTNTDLQN